MSIAFKLAEAWVDFMLKPNDLLPKQGWVAKESYFTDNIIERK